MLAVQKTPWNSSLSSWLTLLDGLLWSYFTVFLWVVGLEVIKQVRFHSMQGNDRKSNKQLVFSTIFINRKTEVLPDFAFARSVLSLTEEPEVEDSSVAIFIVWSLALVHMHACACLGARSKVGWGLSISTVCILIAYHRVWISIDISHCRYYRPPLAITACGQEPTS